MISLNYFLGALDKWKVFYVFEIGENDVLCKFCDYLMAFLYVAILILVLLLFFIIIFYKVYSGNFHLKSNSTRWIQHFFTKS